QDRDKLTKSVIFASERERDQQLTLLAGRLKDDLDNLARQYPEAEKFDKDAREVEKRLQVLGDKYSAECQRREEELRRWLEGSPTVSVVSVGFLDDPDKLRERLVGEEGRAETKPLTEAEQKEYAERSIHYFAAVARGEIPGYDV